VAEGLRTRTASGLFIAIAEQPPLRDSVLKIADFGAAK
jgi:hypothetical protein